MTIDFTLLGKRIARRRRDLGLRQNEVAERADLSNNYLSNIETGRSIPSLNTFAQLCEVLDATPDFFLLGTMKANNLPQNIMDNLRLCDEKSLTLINKMIQCVLTNEA